MKNATRLKEIFQESEYSNCHSPSSHYREHQSFSFVSHCHQSLIKFITLTLIVTPEEFLQGARVRDKFVLMRSSIKWATTLFRIALYTYMKILNGVITSELIFNKIKWTVWEQFMKWQRNARSIRSGAFWWKLHSGESHDGLGQILPPLSVHELV